MEDKSAQSPAPCNRNGIIFKAATRTFAGDIIIGMALFLAAGDWTWKEAWIYWIVLVFSTTIPLVGPFRLDEGLIEERLSPKPGGKSWDKYFVGSIVLFTIAELLVPGLDHRWGWTGPQAQWISIVGAILLVAGTAGIIWAMRANRFFSAIVRIQTERGHQVISTGPYKFVRHPGYLFWIVRTIGVPLLFSSNWAFIVVGLFIATMAVRTALEDRVLFKELTGYQDYAKEVRWRLMRGIW